jgi:putative tricarboxylic transport membrane protein
VFLLLLFGIVGYFMSRYGYSPAGFAIGLVLGQGVEGFLRRGVLLTDSSWWEFVSRPWTAALLAVSFAFIVYGGRGALRLSRESRAIRQRALARAQAAMQTSRLGS